MLRLAPHQAQQQRPQRQLGRRWSPGCPHSELATGGGGARRKTEVRMVAQLRTESRISIWWLGRSRSGSLSGRMRVGSAGGEKVTDLSLQGRGSGRGSRGIVAVMDKAELETDHSEITGLRPGDAYAEAPSSELKEASSFNTNMNKATKWIAALSAVAVVLWRHDESAMWFSIGAVVNGGLCKLLKKLVNESRPQTATGVKSDPGMPSSHAQGLSFLGTYAAAVLLLWLGPNAWTIFGATSLICTWMYWSWLRISEGLHTVPQVLVGNALGVAIALGWLFLWKAVLESAVHSSGALRIVLIALFVIATLVCYFISFKNWKLGEM